MLVITTSAVLLDGCAAWTNRKRSAPEILNFTSDINPEIEFVYPDTTGNEFLRRLRNEYNLLTLINNCSSGVEKAKVLTHWTSTRWRHASSNRASKNDALTILDEARQGRRFRCVEYSVVLCAALNSVGLKSRVLALKVKDVETRQYGAGHVVVETYLPDLGKWIMADGQFNAIPTRDNVPLNAVELQKVLSSGESFRLVDQGGTLTPKAQKRYQEFINEYLYYFDVAFDNRTDYGNERLNVKGKVKLMLVPIGAKQPEVFELSNKIDYCLYSNSLADFYRRP
jgi:hypothetical protein